MAMFNSYVSLPEGSLISGHVFLVDVDDAISDTRELDGLSHPELIASGGRGDVQNAQNRSSDSRVCTASGVNNYGSHSYSAYNRLEPYNTYILMFCIFIAKRE